MPSPAGANRRFMRPPHPIWPSSPRQTSWLNGAGYDGWAERRSLTRNARPSGTRATSWASTPPTRTRPGPVLPPPPPCNVTSTTGRNPQGNGQLAHVLPGVHEQGGSGHRDAGPLIRHRPRQPCAKFPAYRCVPSACGELAYYLDHYHAYGANMTAIWQVIFA